jgi:hypothetical protein
MSESTDKAAATRLLRGLEGGGMTAFAARAIAEKLDPVLLYVVVRYLREAYPASNPAASPVLDRVVALTSAWPGLVARSKEGEHDPIGQWFTENHSFGEFRGRGAEMIALVVDKLES